MALQPPGWYTDPTHAYTYRYWNGTAWSNRVSTGGTTGTDPNELGADTATTPPAPGTEAPSSPQPAPTVQVTQSSSGSAFGVIFGMLIAVLAVVVLIIVLVNASSDDTPVPTTRGSVTTEAPASAPTEIPVTTVAP